MSQTGLINDSEEAGVHAELARFSGESHGLSRSGVPWQGVFRLDKMSSSFRYLKGDIAGLYPQRVLKGISSGAAN